jgi:chaperone required for assembly of F1-ATPase
VKKFYKAAAAVEADQGHAVQLDGRPVKTPAKNVLNVPARALADAIAAEWGAQGEDIDAHEMRLTRLANSAIDRIVEHRHSVVSEIAGYIETDLVCYRAESPEGLAKAQEAGWGPLVSWIHDRHGVDLEITTGLLPVAQSNASIDAVRAAVAEFDVFSLAGLHMVTVSSGSVVIGLAVADDRIDGTAAWELSLIDETFQLTEWGEDPDATKRRAGLRDDIAAGGAFMRLCRSAD